jgi:hypothetical protein
MDIQGFIKAKADQNLIGPNKQQRKPKMGKGQKSKQNNISPI